MFQKYCKYQIKGVQKQKNKVKPKQTMPAYVKHKDMLSYKINIDYNTNLVFGKWSQRFKCTYFMTFDLCT